ncbi:Alpha/Beta hydrolase protein [Mycena olivaceomarginata]|nr:Alpha/Beta hydrolase protein [Mycena olivaceomarginata]
MTQALDLSYIPGTNDSLRSFDLHVPSLHTARESPMIIFVHGGAWRSSQRGQVPIPALARNLAEASNAPVLVPNYRLTPSKDILHFLDFITSDAWPGVPELKFTPTGTRLYLLGHSAGAHILSSIFLDSSAAFPSLTPPPAVLKAARGIVMTEGIYDIDLLLAKFPDYRQWFIAADASTTGLALREGSPENLRWLVIHSKGDTLVDQPQSDAIVAHLGTLYGGGAAADARGDAQRRPIRRGA